LKLRRKSTGSTATKTRVAAQRFSMGHAGSAATRRPTPAKRERAAAARRHRRGRSRRPRTERATNRAAARASAGSGLGAVCASDRKRNSRGGVVGRRQRRTTRSGGSHRGVVEFGQPRTVAVSATRCEESGVWCSPRHCAAAALAPPEVLPVTLTFVLSHPACLPRRPDCHQIGR
jgi:hypothetical protein